MESRRGHGAASRVWLDGQDVSPFLTHLTVNLDVNDVNRATLEAAAFSVEDFTAEAEVRFIVKCGPYIGRGNNMGAALRDMVERYDRAQEA